MGKTTRRNDRNELRMEMATEIDVTKLATQSFLNNILL